MSLKIDKVQLDIIINNDPARVQMRQLTDDLKAAQKELRKLPEGTKEWIAQSEKIKQIQTNIEGLKREIGLTGMTLNELSKHQKELNAVMRNMNPRLPEYKILQQELKETTHRISELRGNAQNTGLSLNKLADGFNKYFGLIAGIGASLTGVIFGFRKLVDSFNEYEKKVDNLSALTGLAGEELNWLSDQAKELSTATVEGGVRITQSADQIVDAYTKVGSARPELLKNKEALNEVTKEAIILSEAANTELQPAVEALAMVLNQFNAPATDSRRIINALAAGSKEGAGEIPYLTQAIEKSGTVAADVGMSYEQLIGTIETLAPRITQPEIAGRSLKGVILDLQKTADDTNPAVVGFAKAIENLGEKHLSTAELIKIFGSENITVAKILLDNQQETIKYTKAVTDTNVAIEQASINTDNNASKLAQAKNKAHLMALELGEKLAPALTFSTNAFTYLVKVILSVIQVYKEHSRIINSALIGLGAYSVVVYGAAAAKKIYTIATNIATAATNAFNTASKASSWGIIAGLVAAVAASMLLFKENMASATKTQIALNDASAEAKKRIVDEKFEIEQLIKVAKDETKSKEERKKAIQRLNQISPEYLGNLTLEKINTNEATQAVDSYIKSLEKKMYAEVLQEKIKEELKKQIDIENSKLEDNIGLWDKVKNYVTTAGNTTLFAVKNSVTAIDNQSNSLKESKDLVKNYESELKKLAVTTETSIELENQNIVSKKEAKITYEQLNAEIAKYEKLLNDQIIAKSDMAPVTAQHLANLKAQKEVIDELNKVLSTPLTKIKSKKDGTDTSGDKHKAELDEIVRQNNLKLQVERDFQESRAELLKKYADYSSEEMKQEELKVLDSLKKDELLTVENYEQAKADIEEKYRKNKEKLDTNSFQIWLDENKKTIANVNAIQTASINLISGLKDLALIKAETRYNAEIKAAGNNVEQKEKIEKNFNEEKKAIAKKYADFEMAIKISQIIASTAVSIMQCLAQLGPVAGAIAAVLVGATGAVQIGVAIAERNQIAQAKEGKYPVIGADDGKTYDASVSNDMSTRITREPTLLVGEEAPELIVDGPTLKNLQMNYPEVLQAIQYARSPQYASGLYPQKETITNNNSQMFVDPEMLDSIKKLNGHLENGIKSYMVYSEYQKFITKTEETENNFNLGKP